MSSRRRFLKVLASTSVGAVVFAGCRPADHELSIESRARLAEDLVSAQDNWYATACRGCDAGCGVIVRVVEGRAKKVEGNPVHPVNRGKLCARGQAMVQEQYHPDRIPGPLLRNGERGPGPLTPISWEDALALLTTRVQGARADRIALLTRPARGHEAIVLDRFAALAGARWLRLDVSAEAPLQAAVSRVFGQNRLPHFDLEHARFVLSFGADFLSTWLSPVQFGVQYGRFRQGEYSIDEFAPREGTARPRGYLVQVEPRMSLTAANADEWVPIRPGYEGLLALSLAHVIVTEGWADPAAARELASVADERYRPDQVAGDVSISADRIRQLARAFAGSVPSLALGGGSAAAHTNGTDSLAAILGLNKLVGSVNRPGGVLFNPPAPNDALASDAPPSGLPEWTTLARDMAAGRVDMVLIRQADPAFTLPAEIGFRDALERVPFVVSFASFMDDSTAFADLILPTHLPLEDWGITTPSPAPGSAVVTLQQPVVRPLHDTRPFHDVLAAIVRPSPDSLLWTSSKDVVRSAAVDLSRHGGGPGEGAELERFWVELLRTGVWGDGANSQCHSGPSQAQDKLREESPGNGRLVSHTREIPRSARNDIGSDGFSGWARNDIESDGFSGSARNDTWAQLAGAQVVWTPPRFSGAVGEYPMHLLLFPHATLGDGRHAHLPWLQGAPDPVTSVTWQTWAELNPALAKELGIAEGDVVALDSPHGRIEVPVYVNPAAPSDAVGVPIGQGHMSYGRWASERGANPLAILSPLADGATGALAYAATRVRLTRTSRRAAMPKLEGSVPAYQLPGEEVLKVELGQAGIETSTPARSGESPTIPQPSSSSNPYAWGMVVDLDRCIGCQACVVACQAENNIPINDERSFLDRRAIEWIRIERYWEGEYPDVKARFLPVLCQHCGNAPCEAVCPVYATQHSADGLNVQVYNRCVGTRYCGNNCPYSVRFFNWSEPRWPLPLADQLNPDVTVRSRGVIEKCTFCLQRINRARRDASRTGGPIRDGELQPACAQACPTSALVFGNRKDANSRVSRLAADPRGYRLLDSLGTDPAVVYLKAVDAEPTVVFGSDLTEGPP